MSEQAFQRFVRELNADITLTGPRCFELVFEEPRLVARTTLAPDDHTVVVDIYVHDVGMYYGGVRRSLVRALLTINDVAVRHSSYSVSIDTRSFLVLTGRLSLDGPTAAQALDAERFNTHLSFWLEQAQRLRDLAQTLAFEGADLRFELTPMEHEE